MKARFFLDNCLSPRFARALRELAEPQGFEIVHLSEKFDRDTPDDDWLRALGVDGGWIVVSGDPRITRSKVERSAWQESGLTAFFFAGGWSSKSYWKQAADVVAWWPTIVLEGQRAASGSGFLIPLKGTTLKWIFPPPHESDDS